MSFDVALIVQSIPKMLEGLGLTLQLLFLSSAIGLVLAVFTLLMRISRLWFLAWPAMLYISAARRSWCRSSSSTTACRSST